MNTQGNILKVTEESGRYMSTNTSILVLNFHAVILSIQDIWGSKVNNELNIIRIQDIRISKVNNELNI